MSLYDYMIQHKDVSEFTVYDDTCDDIEIYFYNPLKDDSDNISEWDNAMMKLAKTLKVTSDNGPDTLCVNLYDILDAHIDELNKTDLFIIKDLDAILDDIPKILAGNVSEDWFLKFIEIITKED